MVFGGPGDAPEPERPQPTMTRAASPSAIHRAIDVDARQRPATG